MDDNQHMLKKIYFHLEAIENGIVFPGSICVIYLHYTVTEKWIYF